MLRVKMRAKEKLLTCVYDTQLIRNIMSMPAEGVHRTVAIEHNVVCFRTKLLREKPHLTSRLLRRGACHGRLRSAAMRNVRVPPAARATRTFEPCVEDRVHLMTSGGANFWKILVLRCYMNSVQNLAVHMQEGWKGPKSNHAS
jgi:hypothetical protein